MKSTICVLFLGLLLLTPTLGQSTLQSLEDYLEAGFEQISHEFGGIQMMREAENLAEYVVYWPENGFLSEPNHLLDVYSIMLASHEEPEKYNLDNLISCNPGAKSDYFKWAPYKVGVVKIGEVTTVNSPCFGENSVTLKMGDDGKSVILEHNASNYSSWTCADTYLYATTQNYHFSSVFFSGTHRYTFSGLTDYQMKEIQRDGIQLLRVCDSVANIFPDIFKTVLLFAGGLGTNPYLPFIGSHPTFWMVSNNVEFIKRATGYEWKKRANTTRFDYDAKNIKSGDYFAITRWDGLDQIIEWGTGSHSGHTVAAIWVEEELYVVESQDAWYWPRHGIQMNPYKTWLEWADNAGFMVTHLPLKAEVAAKFNVTKAYEWYKTVEGYPYGYHNFLWGWVDTPNDSFPPVLHSDAVAPAMAIVQGLFPAASTIFNEAINFRLNTSNLTIPELAEVIAERNLTWGEVYAMPEQDSWRYSDGPSMVCSSFVVALWKAGGLFGDMEIQATEFTPRDVYTVTFLDPNPVLAPECLENNPNARFCQLMGDHHMEFPDISTVEPYPHMNERCPSSPLNGYKRLDGC